MTVCYPNHELGETVISSSPSQEQQRAALLWPVRCAMALTRCTANWLVHCVLAFSVVTVCFSLVFNELGIVISQDRFLLSCELRFPVLLLSVDKALPFFRIQTDLRNPDGSKILRE